MITESITASFLSNTLDVTTIAGILFSVILIIYFFVAIKPGLDSKVRVNRQVQRRVERDRVNEKYQKTIIKQQLGKNAKAGDVERVYKQQQAAKSAPKKPYRKNNGYYSKDKGYQAYLKRNTLKTAKNLNSVHSSFKKAAAAARLKSLSGRVNRPNSGRFSDVPSSYTSDKGNKVVNGFFS